MEKSETLLGYKLIQYDNYDILIQQYDKIIAYGKYDIKNESYILFSEKCLYYMGSKTFKSFEDVVRFFKYTEDNFQYLNI